MMADEATDCSNQEQLPRVLRFVDEDGIVQETFAGFYSCEEGVTGDAIDSMLERAIESLGLRWGRQHVRQMQRGIYQYKNEVSQCNICALRITPAKSMHCKGL